MKISVIRSAVIEAPIERVWALLRDFNSHGSWHPAVARSLMENDMDGDVVGGVRRFSLIDGAEIREQLLYHSDAVHTFTYSILDSPLPLFDYVATLRLRPITDANHTFLDWRSQFRTSKERAAELENLVGKQIYEAGIAGLRKLMFEKTTQPSQLGKKQEEVSFPKIEKGDPFPCKAVVQAPADNREIISLIDLTVPPPKSGQVRLRLTAMGINPMTDSGRTESDKELAASWAPSIEGVGEVLDVGPQVHGLFSGDRVAYIDDGFGAYAEIRCVDADACIHLQDSISDIQASTLFKGISAQVVLNRIFNAGSGSTIMLHGVSGGLGHILSQWAKSIGMTVIGTVFTTDEARFSRSHGCDYPLIDSDDGALRNEVMRITNGRGVDYWVHRGDEPYMDTALSCMARFGHIAVLGNHSKQSIAIDVAVLNQRSLTVSVPSLLDYLRQRSYLQRVAQKVFNEIEKKNVIPAIKTFPLNQASDAFTQLHTRETMEALSLILG